MNWTALAIVALCMCTLIALWIWDSRKMRAIDAEHRAACEVIGKRRWTCVPLAPRQRGAIALEQDELLVLSWRADETFEPHFVQLDLQTSAQFDILSVLWGNRIVYGIGQIQPLSGDFARERVAMHRHVALGAGNEIQVQLLKRRPGTGEVFPRAIVYGYCVGESS